MDPYFKKEIVYPYQGIRFSFEVAHTLFSTFAIDHGTDMLLRHMTVNNPRTILDIGCGYGVIGIVLAKTHPNSEITMLDANLLAVRYANINIRKNEVTNATVMGSVAMEAVANKTFDLIVSNIPAKIGDAAIAQDFILSPYEHLNQHGELWLVAISALNRLIPGIGAKNNMNMKLVRKRRGHSLYQIKK